MDADSQVGRPAGASRVSFGPFTFDRETGELRRDGRIVDLPPQPTRVLALLLSRPGQLVTRKEFREEIWPDTIIEFDHGLNTCIRTIRVALGESSAKARYVQTVPRRGYRFTGDVLDGSEPHPPAESDRLSAAVGDDRSQRSVARVWWPWAAVALVLVTATGIALAGRLRHAEPPSRLAILGFDNLSPDAVPDFALHGLVEEVVRSLAASDPTRLTVLARGSAEAVRHRPLAEAAEALRATHVLTGTARSTPTGIVVTASLARVSDQSVLWAERYRAEADDIAARVDDLAARVAQSVAGEIGGTARSAGTERQPAELVRARYLLDQGRPADAISQLSGWSGSARSAQALALLARARSAMGDTAGARHAAERALRIDPDLAEAHFAIGELAMWAWWDWPAALREYRESIRLEPARAEFRHSFALLLSVIGEHPAAMAEVERALDLDPVSPIVNGDVAWVYYFAREFERAVRQARITLDLVPEFTPAMLCLMLSHERLGELERARTVAARLAEALEASPEVIARIRNEAPEPALAIFWRTYVDHFRTSGEDGRDAFRLAYGYAFLGQVDSAFVFLERAFRDRSPTVRWIAVDPRFDRIRQDDRFGGYVDRLALPRGLSGSGAQDSAEAG